MLAGLVNGNHVHKSTWVMWFSSNSVINLDKSFLVLHNFEYLSSVESILESVLEKNA